MTWRTPARKRPPVRCPACAREPFLTGWEVADHRGIREEWACACGHRFTHRAHLHRIHREVVEAQP